MIRSGWINILEDSIVTVTSSATGYDSYRLYDRIFGRLWVATSTGTQTIHVDQGASPVSFDALVIPSGHTLSGCGMTFEGSNDNSNWTPIVTGWTQNGSGWIVKKASGPVSYRYVRVVISGASIAPEAGEIFITRINEFPGAPLQGATISRKSESDRSEGIGGLPKFVINGNSRKVLRYTGKTADATERADLLEWFTYWANHRRPFFLEDHDGNYLFCEFVDDPELLDSTSASAIMNLRQIF